MKVCALEQRKQSVFHFTQFLSTCPQQGTVIGTTSSSLLLQPQCTYHFQHTVQTFTPANVLPLLPYLRRAARALQYTHTITGMRQYASATLISALRS
jgi:hypothetical protein